MKNLNIYITAGGMKITYLVDLPDKIVRKKVNSQIIRVPRLGDPDKYCFNGKSDPLWPEASIIEETYKLNPFYRSHNVELMHYKNHPYEYQPTYLAEKQKIITEFKTMLAKKNPFAFIKDLNLEKINELSNEYAQKFGDSNLIGVEANLSQYQKFFSIINLNDLVFYMAEFKHITSDSTIYKGKLINTNPDNWICYRYENLMYLNELNSMNYFNNIDKDKK